MFKGLILKSSLPFLIFFGAAVEASEVPERNFNIGATSYATVISDGSSTNQELFGGGLIATYAFSDRWAARLNVGALSHDSFDNVDSETAELAILLGRGLSQTGFKFYLGGGLYQDKWSVKNSSASETFSGTMLTGGLGYNWSRISLEFWLSLRKSSEYDSIRIYNHNTSDAAVSGGWAVSLRF